MSAIMKSQQKNINVEVDWDQLDTFFVDQYVWNVFFLSMRLFLKDEKYDI